MATAWSRVMSPSTRNVTAPDCHTKVLVA
ncbi:MAG: hypothetical protein QOK39_794, partial [Acidimicrobiaceae bacterium]|nr:hypothetical protein [Acidimicrobiaceae bacterium]